MESGLFDQRPALPWRRLLLGQAHNKTSSTVSTESSRYGPNEARHDEEEYDCNDNTRWLHSDALHRSKTYYSAVADVEARRKSVVQSPVASTRRTGSLYLHRHSTVLETHIS